MQIQSEIDYTRHYSHWHDGSDADFSQQIRDMSFLLGPYFPINKSIPILDIGCGMGFAVASFLNAGFVNAQGIDADIGQVNAARKRELPVQHVPVTQTLDWFAERQGRFGLIVAIDVLEHIQVAQQIEFLKSVRNMLSPEGTFICRVPNANSSVASVFRYVDWTHVISFTPYSLDFVLFNAGFQDIRIEDGYRYRFLSRRLATLRHWLLGFTRGLRRLEMIAEFGREKGGNAPLDVNIIAVARKQLRP